MREGSALQYILIISEEKVIISIIYKGFIKYELDSSILPFYLLTFLATFCEEIGLLRDATSLLFSKQEHLEVTLP